MEVQNSSYGWIYRYSPSVRRVVDYIGTNVSQLGLKVYERAGNDDRLEVGDHPAARALRRPNAHTHGKRLIFNLIASYLIFDNAYAVKFRVANGDLMLVNVSPAAVGLLGDSYFAPDGYRIFRPDGTFFDVARTDVFHWRGYNPDDPRKGESKLETLREELAADAAARQAATELHRSGLSLPGWIERPMDAPEWSDDARKRFEEDWANRAKQGTRKSPVLEEGMIFKQGGISPEDAELLAGRKFTMDYVASLYGMKNVPPETADERSQFYADVLAALTADLADALGLQILEDEFFADDHYFEFNLDEKLMGEDRLKALTSAAGAPILTRNEARAMANRPAKEGGDELITPRNVFEGTNPLPSVDVMPIQDPNKPSQDGDHREQSLNGNGKVEQKLLIVEKSLIVPRHIAAARRRQEYASDFADTLKSFLSRQERTLKSRQMDSKAVADERWERELTDDLIKSARRAVAREGGVAAARIGLADIDLKRVEHYLRTFSEEKAKQIVQALRERLADGEAAEVFAQAKDVDAPRAADTFATSMAAFAVREAGQQSPDAEQRLKTWIVTSGNSAHPELNGQSVPLGEEFSNGASGPPADHPGCQCIIELT